MKDYLTTVPTALRPTAPQFEQLRLLFQTADDLHLTIRRWLRLQGKTPLDLKTTLQLAADGATIPEVADDQLAFSATAVEPLRALQYTDLPEKWRTILPSSVATAIINIEVKRLVKLDGRLTLAQVFALTPLERVPLDAAITPVDLHHVYLEGTGLIVCDFWALPSDVSTALLQETGEVAATVRHEQGLKLEQLAQGEMRMMPELYATAERDAVFSRLHFAGQNLADQAELARLPHASLVKAVDICGANLFLIHWSVRLPGDYLPAASVPDALGIDLGYRHLAVTANANEIAKLTRKVDPRGGLLTPPNPESLAQQLAFSQARAALFEVHRDQLEGLVRTALTYEEVHVEDLNWENMRQGMAAWVPEAANLVGVPHITRWLKMLKVATGTRLILVDPAYTSITCAACAEAGTPRHGTRPAPYTYLHCPVHGELDADENGAKMIRISKGWRVF